MDKHKQEVLQKIKQKKEFSKLPDSIVEKIAESCDYNVKESRALLRKYFGVFLTNKVVKGASSEVLKSHISSKKRDYNFFYKAIFENLGDIKFKSIIDLGAGVNGLSYPVLKEFLPTIKYIALEAAGQLVDNMNFYFKENNFNNANAIQVDLFDLENVEKIIFSQDSPKIIFMFQLVDALEKMERDFSKKLLLKLKNLLSQKDYIVISFPIESLSGKTKFIIQRKWLVKFIIEEFNLITDFKLFGERILIFKNKD